MDGFWRAVFANGHLQRDSCLGRELLINGDCLFQANVDNGSAKRLVHILCVRQEYPQPGKSLPLAALGLSLQCQAFAIRHPLALVRMVWHVEVGKQALRPEVRVHGEQELAHERWCFKVVEEMLEEMCGIDIAGIAFVIGAGRAGLDRAVVVDNNLVNGEDRAGSRNTAGPCRSLFAGYAVGNDTGRYGDGNGPVSRGSRLETCWLGVGGAEGRWLASRTRSLVGINATSLYQRLVIL